MKIYKPWIFDDTAETTLTQLNVTDDLPRWLNGNFVRNGPSLFNFPGIKLNHWYDGMGIIHKFSFNNGQVDYLSKILQSKAYLSLIRQHKIAYYEFATSPKKSLFAHIYSLIKGKLTDNNNVNIIKFGKYYLAMTETDYHVLIDTDTLLPIGVKAYKDDIKLAINLAHPIVEEKNNLLYNLGIKLGFVSTYNLYQANLDEGVRKIIAQIPTKSPAYIHTFAKTPNFFIIYENPLRLKLSKLFFANKSFIDSYVWTNKPINFIILNTSGKVLMQIEHEPSFCFHVVNSFEFKDKIYLDLITYPNADIIQAFYLNSQINLDKHNITPTLYRYILDMNTSSCSKYKLIDQKIEFPIINNNYMQKAYNFIYATSIIHNEFQLDSLIKIDLANNLYKIWHESGCFPSEAVFIAKPDGLIEDEGVIMSIVADIKHKVSFLLVLDAKSFHEITRISLPHMLPMGLHGAFYPTPEKNAK